MITRMHVFAVLLVALTSYGTVTQVSASVIADSINDFSGAQGQGNSLIDFAIDPLGVAPPTSSDGDFSARADGSHFSATLTTVPEPTGLAVFLGLGISLVGIQFWRNRRRCLAGDRELL